RTPERPYSFAHALVQEVAYRTQLMTNRRRMHVTVGDAYASLFEERVDEFVDTLAFHYRRGDDDPKARTWLLRAGHRAQQLYANAEAVDYFSAAIERSAGDPAERAGDDAGVAEALKQLGTVHGYRGDLAEALRYQVESLAAYERVGDLLGKANVQNNIGRTERRRSRHDAALDAYRDALAIRERI